MAELRHVGAYWSRSTGKVVWQVVCVIDMGQPFIEFEGTFHTRTKELPDIRVAVQYECFTHTRSLGSALKMPPLDAIAVVEVPHD